MRAGQPLVGLLLWYLASLLTPPGSCGTEPPSDAKKDKTEPGARTKADKQARREAEQVVRGVDLEVLSDDKWTRVERIEKPLLFYEEPTRNNDRGSVWGWGRKGRPVALLELFRGAVNRTSWTFAICNTSGGKLRARRADAPWWRENDSASELKDVPGAGGRSPAEATANEAAGREVHGP
jgi:hypothetical protein